MSNPILRSLVGQTFGSWTVLRRNVRRGYICRCVCGTERAIQRYPLVHGITKSCGCAMYSPPLGSLNGKQFGSWTVVGEATNLYRGRARGVLCQCACGAERAIPITRLVRGESKSCGCLKGKIIREKKILHGESKNMRNTPEYNAWAHLIGRCCNPNNAAYENYGGRGVTVCDEWRNSYAAFLAYVGRRPTPRHTIDRIDNNGNYEPGNVRWATYTQQSRNRRNTLLVNFRGEKVCLRMLMEKYGLSLTKINFYLRRKGLSLDEAFDRAWHMTAIKRGPALRVNLLGAQK